MARSYTDFLAALRMRESSGNYTLVNSYGFLGAYQFGEGALIDLGFVNHDGNWQNNDFSGGWTGKFGIHSKADFLNSPAVQDAVMAEWVALMWGYLTALGADAWLGKTVGGVTLTASGLIGGAHLLGQGNVMAWLESGGTKVLRDAYGTPISEYISLFNDYDLPIDVGDAVGDAVGDLVSWLIAEVVPGWLAAQVDKLLDEAPQVQQGADGVNDALTGTAGSDVLTGGTGGDRLAGDRGNDLLLGGGNADQLFGGGGHDVVLGGVGHDQINGGLGHDRLLGNGGNDRISGGGGNDRLFGGAGNDRLAGDSGNDSLTGNAGADTFVFASGGGDDRVRDFSAAEGDRIDLAGVGEITGYGDLMQNHIREVGSDVVIETGAGDTITLKGVSLAELDADAFVF